MTIPRFFAILFLIGALLFLGYVVLYTTTEGIGANRFIFEVATASPRGVLVAVLLISAGILFWRINFKEPA